MPYRCRLLCCLLPVVATWPALIGCNSSALYIIQQGYGQVMIVTHTVSIDDALAGDTLTAEQQRKLTLVTEARDFARDVLGLSVGDSFQDYHDTGGEPVAWNLSSARRDALVSREWWFPIIGDIAYLGFFSRDDADRAAERLADAGEDTYIYGVDAYSTLGWFPDPVHTPFLNRSDGSVVETVIHELAHNTIYAPGQSTFNESLATYIGRLGVQLFYAQQGDAGQEIVTALERTYGDQEKITAWMTQFETDLRAYYASDLSSEEKIAGREAVFQAARDRFVDEVQPQLAEPQRYAGWANLPTNNAYVLLHRRYHLDLDVFADRYAGCDGDFAAFLNVLRQAAAADDPFAALREGAGSP
ncbi:MAG: aminopeptidase [Phycisphaerae bacterium]